MKTRPIRVELFHVNRQTDGRTVGYTEEVTKLIVAFRNFSKAPKNIKLNEI